MKNNTKLERAKIFLPFDALKGLQEALRLQEKIYEEKITTMRYDIGYGCVSGYFSESTSSTTFVPFSPLMNCTA